MAFKKGTRPGYNRFFNGELFELGNGDYLPGGNGFTKREAQKHADEWRKSYPGSKARIVQWKNKYWVYVN